MLVISILYNGEIEGFECVFPCFLPDYDAVSMPRKLQKWIVLFSCFTQFWACNEADEPHFSALYTPKLHLCTLVLMPGTRFLIPQKPIWDVPFCHLGCPILPFGVYFRHICAQCTVRFSVCLLRFFAAKVCVFSFLSIHHVSSGFAWQDKIYFITLSSITLYYHGTIQGIRI